jgi:hypothetical protein
VKPDVPLTPTDISYVNLARGTDTPQIASTYSDFGDLRTTYVFAYTQGSNARVQLRPVDVGVAAGAVYVYDSVSGTGQLMEATDAIDRQITGDSMYLVMAPVGRSGIAVVGDTGHFVTMGKKRVSSVADNGNVEMTLAFAAGEGPRTITGYSSFLPAVRATEGTVTAVRWDRPKRQFHATITAGDSGRAVLTIGRRTHPVSPSVTISGR